jgi:ABC-type uncharacterized transport system auxiliary subunit
MSLRSLILLGTLATTLSACALMSKSEPLRPRYFTPNQAGNHASASAPRGPPALDGSRPSLRLGRVTAGDHLRERIAFRTSDHELAFHEDLRWTERPEVYLRLALNEALFESGRLTHVISGDAPTLDVELIAFEELLGPKRLVRLQARFMLHDGRTVRVEESLYLEAKVSGEPNDETRAASVRAFSEVLNQAVMRIADQVTTALRAAEPSAPEAPPVSVGTL